MESKEFGPWVQKSGFIMIFSTSSGGLLGVNPILS
jgi:hypothetical protein